MMSFTMLRLMHEMQRMGYHFFELIEDGPYGFKINVCEDLRSTKMNVPLLWGICKGLDLDRGAGTSFSHQIKNFEGLVPGTYSRPGQLWKGVVTRKDMAEK